MALAQDVPFDANGPDLPVWAGGPQTVWDPGALLRQPMVGAVADVGTGLLGSFGGSTSTGLATGMGLQLGGAWAPIQGLGLVGSLPVYPLAVDGFALGDLRIAVPLVVDGGTVGVVPWLRAPTGSRAKGVSAGVSGGVVATGAARMGDFAVHGNLGASLRPAVQATTYQRLGGAALDAGLAVGRQVDSYGAFLEVRTRWTPGSGPTLDVPDIPDASLFGEVGASVHANTGPWTVGGTLATGFGRAPGTAVVRAVLGIARRFGTPPEAVDDPAGPVVKASLPCLAIEGPTGPLVGLAVTVGDRVTSSGSVCLDGEVTTVEVAADGYAPLVVTVDRASSEEAPQRVELVPRAVGVVLHVTDQLGREVPARVTATREGETRELAAGDALDPGTWTVRVESDGLGVQQRVVDVRLSGTEDVDVVLQPVAGDAGLRLVVRDAEGSPVTAAQVLLDGLPVGSTGADGAVALESLAPGRHVASIQHRAFEDLEATLELRTGENPSEVGLDALPGTVRLAVVTPVTRLGRQLWVPVQDAVVRFLGPRELPPLALGGEGKGTQVLGEGTWQVVVASPTLGIQQQEVRIDPSSRAVDLEVVMRAPEDGRVELEVRVIDPTGRPLEGVDIELDGELVGRTSTGGALRLAGLDPGVRVLQLRSPLHRTAEPARLELFEEGLMEHVRVLDWLPGVVEVRASQAAGAVQDASVRFSGPRLTDPVALGLDGRALERVDPGAWEAIVASQALGARQVAVEVPTTTRLNLLDVYFGEPEGRAALEVRVKGPAGEALDGVPVALDGVVLGRTRAGALELDGLMAGQRSL
ncbi:MAG: hypothetical protein KC656_10795, partial [Myxococcales bacterium]|nr:hypothetical protein [Myxococcales bacterium]